MKAQPPALLRCAIYTRVSTDHGLEQEFNSLDNQREAAEAYIKSQAHEGWRCLPARYNDGGFSGGSLERPGLQQLLAEIRAQRIDVVVVYKVDRLTRSLADFAKLVELFDTHGVSFVSVTQAFNTTTSMGRLTLNVLLSFAQFEREVTGERIRDKIAASKKKGIWMGGVVPLGYRAEDRALHIVEEHAALVRELYAEYLRLGSVHALRCELDRRQIRVPVRVDGTGKRTGGSSFSRGHLYKLLSNPVYRGEITHKGRRYAGQHPAIVEEATWEAVQVALSAQTGTRRRRRHDSEALLLGKIFDDRGHPMSPSHAQRGQIRYRYYVSQALLQGRREEAGSRPRVPAPELERLVLADLLSSGQPKQTGVDRALLGEAAQALATELVERVVVRADTVEMVLRGSAPERASETRILPFVPATGRRRRGMVLPAGESTRPIRAEARAKALQAIALGRRWLDELVLGQIADTAALAEREDCSERSVRMTLSLAFVAPAIVQAIVDGTAPRGMGISQLTELHLCWAEQTDALAMKM